MKTFLLGFIFLIVSYVYSQEKWEEVYDFQEMRIADFIIDSTGNMFLGTRNNGIFLSNDFGESWVQRDSSLKLSFKSSFAINANNDLYVCSAEGLFCSKNQGESWENVFNKIWVNCVIISNEGIIFIGTDDLVYFSIDNGLSWQHSKNGFEDRQISTIWSLHFDQNGNLWAGTQCGLYRSEDNGLNWSFIESFDCGDILSFAEKDDGTIYLGGADRFRGIYRSQDEGAIWEQVFDQPTEVFSIVINQTGHVYANSNTKGVFRTINDSVWEEFNNGLSEYGGYKLALGLNGDLYAATYNKLYRFSPSVSNLKENKLKPTSKLLNQNYPNPFNPTTVINYELRINSDVKLIIYDVLGREIETLVNKIQQVGKHKVTFNASNLASGVYYYKLKTGDFEKTRKMLLLR